MPYDDPILKELGGYFKAEEPGRRARAEAWATAIGLQKVDGLTPSQFLLDTAKDHIEGRITQNQARRRIRDYYTAQAEVARPDPDKEEADKVSFGEGNTRTTAVFTIKYLRSLGFVVDNDAFRDNAWYFRNALVRANFADYAHDVKREWGYLETFFRNLLLGERNELKSRYLLIGLTDEDKQKIRELTEGVRGRKKVVRKRLSENVRQDCGVAEKEPETNAKWYGEGFGNISAGRSKAPRTAQGCRPPSPRRTRQGRSLGGIGMKGKCMMKILSLCGRLLLAACCWSFAACGKPVRDAAPASAVAREVVRDGEYTSKNDVARYIKQFGALPRNFITKSQARALGWRGGPLEPYAPGKSIGGDRFGNYERRLPPGNYRECDIDTRGKPRGAKRIVFTPERRVYYTGDHYKTFKEVK